MKNFTTDYKLIKVEEIGNVSRVRLQYNIRWNKET